MIFYLYLAIIKPTIIFSSETCIITKQNEPISKGNAWGAQEHEQKTNFSYKNKNIDSFFRHVNPQNQNVKNWSISKIIKKRRVP